MASITNIQDLQAEIARLTVAQKEQGEALGKRFSSPGHTFSTLMTLFPKAADGMQVGKILGQDIVGLLSRIALPFALNKTLFRKSNFLTKTLVGLVSQKASHFINEASVSSAWHNLMGLFSKKDKKSKPKDLRNYGIPPM
ncbi:hypothetical protein C8P68_102459 [Mucilaginibacter yixingensis]|uniref:Uncharacterized protein n=1 Tax=Mucilaginibacter yixingensis TaxID=1295612 RepID=A0A2T5JCZ5_9SPHI|nr:hypothetical protein [Mucilaginibacter yixingensis]PTQ99632.1 hypothetical protein C8P68_102459 [Mucilaginibacter yixingensis]